MKADGKCCLVLMVGIILSMPKIAVAQNTVTETLNHCDVIGNSDLGNNNSEEDTVADSPNERQVAISGFSVPSLWWAREQFDPFGGKLINNWLAHPQLKQIDLTVNWQLWTLLDYLGRYRFLNQFGTVAREYGYDLRIFDQQQQCLGIYEYNPTSNPPKWEIKLENSGQGGLQVQPIVN